MASQGGTLPSSTEIIVIGTGPHGLAAVAHLRAAGREVKAFGQPMEFWERNMPARMLLRSSHRASFIADPRHALTLDAYEQSHRLPKAVPVPLERFIDYGHWFAGNVLPEPDPRRILRVDVAGRGFVVDLDDGSRLGADRVVVAAGIAPFAVRPPEFAHLPCALVSHTSDHNRLDSFEGRTVLVVGAGQSALECAALLREAGASVEVVARGSSFRWIPADRPITAPPTSAVGRIRRRVRVLQYPPHDVGPWPWNWLVASPDLWPLVPRSIKPSLAWHVNFARGSAWLRPRLEGVPLVASARVVRAREVGGCVDVELSDGTHRLVDHVLLGTGFDINVTRYGFLGPVLLRRLRLREGYPVLRHGMESSVAGLHFLGAPAAATFGPSLRFVTGSAYGARTLTRRVLGRSRRPLDVAW